MEHLRIQCQNAINAYIKMVYNLCYLIFEVLYQVIHEYVYQIFVIVNGSAISAYVVAKTAKWLNAKDHPIQKFMGKMQTNAA